MQDGLLLVVILLVQQALYIHLAMDGSVQLCGCDAVKGAIPALLTMQLLMHHFTKLTTNCDDNI